MFSMTASPEARAYTPTHSELRQASILARVIRDARWSTRSDLIVKVTDSADDPAGYMTPHTAEITLNLHYFREALTSLARRDLDPSRPFDVKKLSDRLIGYDSLDPSRRYGLPDEWLGVAKLFGVCVHESGHADISTIFGTPQFADFNDVEVEIYTALEELRVEAYQVRRDFRNRGFLRAAGKIILPSRDDIEKMKVTLADGTEAISKVSFSTFIAMLLGRQSAGVLNEHEYEDVWDVADDVLGIDTVDGLVELWSRYIAIEETDDNCQDQKADIVHEWVKLLKDSHRDSYDESEDGPRVIIVGGAGKADDDSEPFELREDDILIHLPGLADILADAAEEISEVLSKHPGHEKEDTRYPDEMADPLEKGIKNLFERAPGKTPTERKPSAANKAAAQELARRLERLSVSDVAAVKSASPTPPGKLKVRQAIQNDAAVSRGQRPTAEPWKRTQRRHTTHPKLTVGIEVDVSGSMGWAERFVAESTYVVAKAVNHVHGVVAAVAFGHGVYPIIAPSEMPTVIRQYRADESIERFNESTAALDYKLRLSDPTNGVRLLFIISDGQLVSRGEPEAMHAWVKRLTDAGCAIVWVSDIHRGYTDYTGGLTIPNEVELVYTPSEPPNAHVLFADAIEKAIKERKVAR